MKLSNTNKIIIAIKASIFGLYVVNGSLFAQTLPLPQNLIDFNSNIGEELLVKSNARRDYLPLSIQYLTQNNQAYCGVASMVMVLNALSLPAPADPKYSPHKFFTQENFFASKQTIKVLAPEIVLRQGITLEQLGQFLGSYPVDVNVYHAKESSLEEFRQLATKNLQQSDNFILVNYLRSKIGQERGGHISPIAAYNHQSDRFLILDVSRYKYPPVWVSATDLWQAMATTDSVSGKTRGFVLINRR